MMKRYLFHHQAYACWWLTCPPEKYISSQIGSSSKLLGKIKFMFQATNQIYVYIPLFMGVFLRFPMFSQGHVKNPRRLLIKIAPTKRRTGFCHELSGRTSRGDFSRQHSNMYIINLINRICMHVTCNVM
jgi:hypothetical protein